MTRLLLLLALAVLAPFAALADTAVATPATDLALTLGPDAKPLTYENAATLGDTGVRVLWSKNADGSINGAFDAPSPGWAAFGFPGEGGSMLGGRVVIVTPDAGSPSLASARPAVLAGYSPDKFTEATGLVDGALGAGIPATGRIAATFTFPASAVTGNKVMFATGPMNTMGPGRPKMGIHKVAAVSEIALTA